MTAVGADASSGFFDSTSVFSSGPVGGFSCFSLSLESTTVVSVSVGCKTSCLLDSDS